MATRDTPIPGGPSVLAAGANGNVWTAGKVQGFYLYGEIEAAEGNYRGFPLVGPQAPSGLAECAGKLYIAGGGTGEKMYTYSEAAELQKEFSSLGTKPGQIKTAGQLACEEPANQLLVADRGNNRIDDFTFGGESVLSFGTAGNQNGQLSTPTGVAVAPTGAIYVADSKNKRISEWARSYSTNNPTPPAPAVTENPTWTVEYNVPLSGAGLQTMTATEVAKWGQKDIPAEAGAIFPPDQPMGWPAEKYTRATIYYVDNEMRTVNTVTPAGGITTEEYDNENEVTRILGAANRATALKESNTVAASELLDTKSSYNGSNQLTSTIGPQHLVKLVAGKAGKTEETQARNKIEYFYNEGAAAVEEKTGEHYDLVTKTIDSAETANKEQFDKRTTTTSYNGQENLGWKLRAPTAVTLEPGGIALTTTTAYDKETGNVIESTSPAGNSGERETHVPDTFGRIFGKAGSGGGEFAEPSGAAFDAAGNLWVADEVNNRIQKLAPSGEFLEMAGYGVSNGNNEEEICKTACKAGRSGELSGEPAAQGA